MRTYVCTRLFMKCCWHTEEILFLFFVFYLTRVVAVLLLGARWQHILQVKSNHVTNVPQVSVLFNKETSLIKGRLLHHWIFFIVTATEFDLQNSLWKGQRVDSGNNSAESNWYLRKSNERETKTQRYENIFWALLMKQTIVTAYVEYVLCHII